MRNEKIEEIRAKWYQIKYDPFEKILDHELLDIDGELVDCAKQNIDFLLEEWERQEDTIQSYVDKTVYYRNLAINLGAKPEDMQGKFDRELCEKWDIMKIGGYRSERMPREDTEYRRTKNYETWLEVERLEKEINEITDLLYEPGSSIRGAINLVKLLVYENEKLRQEKEFWNKSN